MSDNCNRCAGRELVPSMDDIANDADRQFHVRACPLHSDDEGPCVVLALPDGVGLRWARLSYRQAIELAAQLVAVSECGVVTMESAEVSPVFLMVLAQVLVARGGK